MTTIEIVPDTRLKAIICNITDEDHSPYHQYLVYVVTPVSCEQYLFCFDGDLHLNEELKIKEKLSKLYREEIKIIKPRYKCCYNFD